jgi:hypothetical protein
MRLITIFCLLLPLACHSAALVHPTVTKINLSGVIGEKGVIEPVNYQIAAELSDFKNVWPNNTQILNKLTLSLNDIRFTIPASQYSELKNIDLHKINLSLVQNWTSVVISLNISYGNYKMCTNHEGNSSYEYSIKTLDFKESGEFIGSRVKLPCVH